MPNDPDILTKFTYKVGELLDETNKLLGKLGNARSPFMVDGFVSYNVSTAKFDQMYISLCQYSNPDEPVGKPIAKIEAVIFSSHLQTIKRNLESASMALKPDLRAVFFGYLDVYKPFGKLQLRITGVDIERTKQVTEGAKDALRRKLKQENFFDHNRILAKPLVPLRIALVTSRGSAAESDFMTKLNLKKFKFIVTKYYVNTSGQNVAVSIPDAFSLIDRNHRDFDLVVLARGGGDHVDLANFSLEGPVRAVVSCKVPVWSAIGHSTDDVLVNEVANKVLSNPNDAASELNDLLEVFLSELMRRSLSIIGLGESSIHENILQITNLKFSVHSNAMRILNQYRKLPGERRLNLVSVGTKTLRDFRAQLSIVDGHVTHYSPEIFRQSKAYLEKYADVRAFVDQAGTIKNSRSELQARISFLQQNATQLLDTTKRDLEVLTAKVDAIDPGRIISMGYALITMNGTMVTSTKGVREGDEILATMHDGEIHSRVESIQGK